MGLAENVRERRLELGLSQGEVTSKTGVTSIKQIETGKILSPRFSALKALAELFGVSVADLYAEPKKPRKRRSAAG